MKGFVNSPSGYDSVGAGHGKDTMPTRNSQIRAAAEAWCAAFGSRSENHLGFVEREIRKALAAREDKRQRPVPDEVAQDRTDAVNEVGSDANAPRGTGDHLDLDSILAADVEKGTDVFWMEVGRGYAGERMGKPGK